MRVQSRWSGFQGAPGYTAFYFMAGGGLISDAQQVADRVGGFWDLLTGSLPNDVDIEVLPEVEVLDEDTGMITDFETIDPPSTFSGSQSGGYSAASGAVINWRTNDLRFGRRIRGRTFIVPLGANGYESDGTLTSIQRDNIQAAADSMVGGDFDSELVVWSRPRDGSGGVAGTVIQASVPDMAAVLRSRRD